jgi:hypothetical protein
MNSRLRRTSSQRFGPKQISLLIGVVVLALLVVTVLAMLQPPEKPAEKFVPTLIGPGLGD